MYLFIFNSYICRFINLKDYFFLIFSNLDNDWKIMDGDDTNWTTNSNSLFWMLHSNKLDFFIVHILY